MVVSAEICQVLPHFTWLLSTYGRPKQGSSETNILPATFYLALDSQNEKIKSMISWQWQHIHEGIQGLCHVGQ
jgi:hypothetical protein